MDKSPTARTLEWCREGGWLVDVVERRIRRTVTKDLFGFIDIVALTVDGETIAIQATSAANVAARRTKIAESENLPVVLAAGWRVWVMGWDHRPAPLIQEVVL